MVYKYVNEHIPFDNTEESELKKLNIDCVIVQPDYQKKPQTSEIQKLIDKVQPGDTVFTSTLVNFSRAYITMVEVLNAFLAKGVRVIAIMEDYDSDRYKDLPWLDQYDWQKKYDEHRAIVLRTNQSQGIAKARREGKFRGHNAARIENYTEFGHYYELLNARKITKLKMAEELGVSRPTLDKLIQQKETEISNQEKGGK